MKIRCVALLMALLGIFVASTGNTAIIVVTSANDTVNGDTSRPSALAANPGPDGISLREAIQAANNEPGPHTITFLPALAGQTIVLTSGFNIDRDGISILGFNGATNRPGVTLDAGAVSPILFRVLASDFTLSRLRIFNLQDFEGVGFNAGETTGSHPTPPVGSNIVLEENEFSNEGLGQFRAFSAPLISLGTDKTSTNARVSNIRIAGNTFKNFRQLVPGISAIHIHVAGRGSQVENVVIRDNIFSDMDFPVELVPDGGTGNRIVGTQIFNNRFLDSAQPINLNVIASGDTTANSIEDTLIAGNLFQRNRVAVFLIAGLFNATGNSILNTQILSNQIIDSTGGGVFVWGGSTGANSNRVDGFRIAGNIFRNNQAHAIWLAGGTNSSNGNTVQNAQIVNNLIDGNTWGISLTGGFDLSNDNRLVDVRIINNTITGSSGAGISYSQNNPNSAGTTGNQISGVVIRNTILWGNASDFAGETSAQVFSSITRAAGFAGTNGNIASDPGFVDGVNGNYRLRSTSPAINAGTSDGAPRNDLDCGKRIAAPDIGAFEYGGSAASCTVYDRVFDWAEFKYPELFSQPAQSASIQGYYYRHYSGTNAYLAANENGRFFYLGPLSYGQILDLGTVGFWSGRAGTDGF